MKVLSLGDPHLPWTQWKILEGAREFAESYQPDVIVVQGDTIDAKAWSKHPKDPDDPSPSQEWAMTEKAVARFHRLWGDSANLILLEGNHCRRWMLRAFEVGIPRELVRPLREVFPFKNWRWWVDTKPLIIDDVRFIHGDEMPGNAWQKAQKLGQSVCQGHDHKGYLDYVNTFEHQSFGMSVGTFIDPQSPAARYVIKNPMTCWNGWGTITDGVPQLHPYKANNRVVSVARQASIARATAAEKQTASSWWQRLQASFVGKLVGPRQ